MQRELTRHLDQAVAEVFAVMLNLACAAESLAQHGPATPGAFCASVFFFGSMRGLCSLHLDPGTARQLTVNLIGMLPEDISETVYTDTVSELCNMIAGSWKSAASQDEDETHLSCPAITPAPTLPPEPARVSVFRRYSFDDHQFGVTLCIT